MAKDEKSGAEKGEAKRTVEGLNIDLSKLTGIQLRAEVQGVGALRMDEGKLEVGFTSYDPEELEVSEMRERHVSGLDALFEGLMPSKRRNRKKDLLDELCEQFSPSRKSGMSSLLDALAEMSAATKTTACVFLEKDGDYAHKADIPKTATDEEVFKAAGVTAETHEIMRRTSMGMKVFLVEAKKADKPAEEKVGGDTAA